MYRSNDSGFKAWIIETIIGASLVAILGLKFRWEPNGWQGLWLYVGISFLPVLLINYHLMKLPGVMGRMKKHPDPIKEYTIGILIEMVSFMFCVLVLQVVIGLFWLYITGQSSF